jgi:hypothetical protein
MGVDIKSGVVTFGGGGCADPNVEKQLRIMAAQVIEFATIISKRQ